NSDIDIDVGPNAIYDNNAAAAAAATDDDDNAAAAAADDDDVAIAHLKIITEHRNHATRLFPDIYRTDIIRGQDVKAVKTDLLIQHFRQHGWTSSELVLTTMTRAVLDDDYKFFENTRLSLLLVRNVSSPEDSKPASTSNDDNNSNPDNTTTDHTNLHTQPLPGSSGCGDGYANCGLNPTATSNNPNTTTDHANLHPHP
ncbi:MAG: hypothetical protein ACKPKO_19750, partial [Candidatus Fonsibacter sp.]